MAFPCPVADSLDPMDHLLSFDVSLIIPKTIWKMIYAAFYPITTYIRGFDPYNRVHRDVCIIQFLLEFSLTWIRFIWLLAFHMPWDRSNSTFHYPFEKIYKEPLGTLKAYRENWSKETIVHYCWNLYLSLHPFVPWSTVVFFPSFPFACELAIERWRIEVVEAQVGDSISPIRRCGNKGCIHCNLWFYINRNIFFYLVMYVWMNISSMGDFKCLYIVDYIC